MTHERRRHRHSHNSTFADAVAVIDDAVRQGTVLLHPRLQRVDHASLDLVRQFLRGVGVGDYNQGDSGVYASGGWTAFLMNCR